MRQSHKGQVLPVVVDSFPVDETVYGIRGMAGGMCDWTASLWKDEGPTIENHRFVKSIDTSNTGSDHVLRGGGWGDGARKFRNQHVGDEAWAKFTDMMERGRKHRAETGEPLMVPRYDIVPMPEHLRTNLAPGSVMMFPADTAIRMSEFIADDVVGNISPRPLLLLHSSEDSVTPTEQSVEMFKRAGNPTDLHLMADVDHFMFTEDDPRVVAVLREWLDRYFPLSA